MNEAVVQYGEWIVFVDEGVPSGAKTRVYRVQTKADFATAASEPTILGTVKWFTRWRKYAFFPCIQTVYEQKCLRDIANFCETVTREHKAKR